ncbi:class I SAM-dependent methyltransferase [Candidatus Roizmanbacteria bacterium]|nr:class I SAM-dependent methyltransferase [Candidatus Roizmanbacteria bacterium]
MTACRICNSKTQTIISFGKMPIANGFVKKPSLKEFVFTLKIVFCSFCYMVQLGETVAPEEMFHDHYQFFSSTSKGMEKHFQEQANHIKELVKNKKNPFVVEIGSNDGIMIKHITAAGIRHLGIEPSKNVAEVSKKFGVNVSSVFFNKKTAQEIVKKYGKADIICGSNVICHIENVNSVFEGVGVLLSDDGYFFFEEPYIYDIVKNNSFDQIYDEHVYYYSGLSVSNLAQKHGLQLVDMRHQDVHGGSMRYYLKKGTIYKISPEVRKNVGFEKRLKLNNISGYKNFNKKVDKICSDLKRLLIKIKSRRNHVTGYAATSKSTTLLNYAKIGPDLIEYISDTTPTKIGLFTPGSKIPVKSYKYFSNHHPKYTLLFAYNHKKEIYEKEKNYRKSGGKFITYFPKVTIE